MTAGRSQSSKEVIATAMTGRPESATCGAQDWAHDDNDQPFVYGTCSEPKDHDGYWHVQYTPSGRVWASWRGPHDARAPEGARDGFLGNGPHDGTADDASPDPTL